MGSVDAVEGSGEGLGDFGAEKVLQKAPGGFGAEFRRRFRRRSGRLWSTLRCFQRLASQNAAKKLVKIKRCGYWGYHRNLFFNVFKQFLVVSLENQPDNVQMPKNGWKFIDVLPNIAQMNPKTHIT